MSDAAIGFIDTLPHHEIYEFERGFQTLIICWG
jgi:hypothetical protein